MTAALTKSKRATGPRSASGKRRAAQNARKHGLTGAHAQRDALQAQVTTWRQGPDGAALSASLLASLAERQQHLARVRGHQMRLMDGLVSGLEGRSGTSDDFDPPGAHELGLALRYRAEAEAAYRKALRAVIDALERHKQGDAVDGQRHT